MPEDLVKKSETTCDPVFHQQDDVIMTTDKSVGDWLKEGRAWIRHRILGINFLIQPALVPDGPTPYQLDDERVTTAIFGR